MYNYELMIVFSTQTPIELSHFVEKALSIIKFDALMCPISLCDNFEGECDEDQAYIFRFKDKVDAKIKAKKLFKLAVTYNANGFNVINLEKKTVTLLYTGGLNIVMPIESCKEVPDSSLYFFYQGKIWYTNVVLLMEHMNDPEVQTSVSRFCYP